uniref:Ornithine decarboxylase n=1 Tax=Lygus hesperus TaxID=30085 RepID=A0A0A9VY66_LYGHE
MAAAYGFNCSLLDIGGGYPGDVPPYFYSSTASASQSECDDSNNTITFEDIAAAIRPMLVELFPDTMIIAEPGRYFTAASHTLMMNVFGERTLSLSSASAQRVKDANVTLLEKTCKHVEDAETLLRDVDWSV